MKSNTVFTSIAVILLATILIGTYLLLKINNSVQAISDTITSWDVSI
jgi:hypothetical protein